MPALRAGDQLLFVEPRLLIGTSWLEVRAVEERIQVLAVETHKQRASVWHFCENFLQRFLIPDREQIGEAEVTTEERQVVVIDREGNGRRPALGVNAENHRHRPSSILEHGDSAWRRLAFCLHPLERFGSPVAVHECLERGVEFRRIAKAMGLDRFGERRDVVPLGVCVPAARLRERNVAQLEFLVIHGRYPRSVR